jgi:hypothetical protein
VQKPSQVPIETFRFEKQKTLASRTSYFFKMTPSETLKPAANTIDKVEQHNGIIVPLIACHLESLGLKLESLNITEDPARLPPCLFQQTPDHQQQAPVARQTSGKRNSRSRWDSAQYELIRKEEEHVSARRPPDKLPQRPVRQDSNRQMMNNPQQQQQPHQQLQQEQQQQQLQQEQQQRRAPPQRPSRQASLTQINEGQPSFKRYQLLERQCSWASTA